jgi:hypothetical protein
MHNRNGCAFLLPLIEEEPMNMFKKNVIMMILFLISVSVAPLRADSASNVFTIAEKNFETPEECINYFAGRLAVNDLDGCLAACAINETDLFDFVKFTRYLGAIVPSSPIPGTTPMFRQMNKIVKMSQITQQVRVMIYNMFSDLRVVDRSVVNPSDDELSAFIRDTDSRRLSVLKVEKIRLPVSAEILNSERARSNAVKQAVVYGADDSTERVVLYKLGDRWYQGGIRLLKFGKYWRIESLSSSYASISLGEMKRISPDEFDSAFGEKE